MKNDHHLYGNFQFCNSLTSYSRRLTREVSIGDVPLGGMNPIRIQSMTTVNTMDTEKVVEQAIRMVRAGCEYVRITAPSVREAENLKNIKEELIKRRVEVPLIADIHFTPKAAAIAARYVEKVRINPGNFADRKKFQQHEYTDTEYDAELERIRERFSPLVKICKTYGTAMRIGTNHGSLSDRIMSRYGDTPLGMVESALEFLRICDDMDFHDIVLSMKASNPKVMVQAYRLLVNRLEEEDMQPYPLHLGVTEAGEAEDGRIKSAVGIGALLEDGLGDTIRVSLTEEPENEIPVARSMVKRYAHREGHLFIPDIDRIPVNPFEFKKRKTFRVGRVGSNQVPVVVADIRGVQLRTEKDLQCAGFDYSYQGERYLPADRAADFIIIDELPNFSLPAELGVIIDYSLWQGKKDLGKIYPVISIAKVKNGMEWHPEMNFITVSWPEMNEQRWNWLTNKSNLVLLLSTSNSHGMAEMRRFFFELLGRDIKIPVIISLEYPGMDKEDVLLYASTDAGGLFVDGLGDGLMISSGRREALAEETTNSSFLTDLSFGILQAAGARITKTEYISCPSCGRTLFDLQETTARIRERTGHLKGIKIGIMGCIVNGPGEMADADYGYVGSGTGKITLYRGRVVVKRSVPESEAVDRLIEIIKEDGRWTD